MRQRGIPYLRAVEGEALRLLIVKHAPHPKRKETLGQYFVRLNINHLDRVTVLEMPEAGGDLVCIHGHFNVKFAVRCDCRVIREHGIFR